MYFNLHWFGYIVLQVLKLSDHLPPIWMCSWVLFGARQCSFVVACVPEVGYCVCEREWCGFRLQNFHHTMDAIHRSDCRHKNWNTPSRNIKLSQSQNDAAPSTFLRSAIAHSHPWLWNDGPRYVCTPTDGFIDTFVLWQRHPPPHTIPSIWISRRRLLNRTYLLHPKVS